MKYKYGMKYRGFSIGCQPRNGFIERSDDPTGKYYDILAYDRQLTEKELEDYELDFIEEKGADDMARKYWIVDCISGCHDEDDEPFTNLKEARAECEIMNREAIKQGHEPGFWIIVDSSGKEIP